MKKIAILGLGFVGTLHAQAYQHLVDAKLVAAVDADGKRADEALGKLGLNLPVYPDLPALLKAVDVDVVDVCLPTDLHTANVVMALQAGKHTICEKPLARTSRDAAVILKAASSAKVFSMAALCIRFWPEYQAFVEFARSGKAGRLMSLTLQRRSARPMWSNHNWLQSGERSGGAALDLHIHDTDFIQHLLGKPRSVNSVGTKDAAGWSHIFTTYEFEGVAVTAEGGWDYPPQWGFQMAFQAVFEKGVVEFDSRTKPSLLYMVDNDKTQPLLVTQPQVGESRTGEGNISSLSGYFNELKYFIECLETNTAPAVATIAQAFDSLTTVLAEIHSAETGKRVRL